jgi:uncharacterized protein
MILGISGIKISLDEGEEKLREKLAAMLFLPQAEIISLKVLRKSLDARRHRPPCFVYVLEAVLPDGICLPDIVKGEVAVSVLKDGEPSADTAADVSKERAAVHSSRAFKAGTDERVIVVGSGPAGLFAAITLSERGAPVLLLERGKPLPERCMDVQAFWQNGELKQESNVLFGEGGAGTFSDGKLTSRAKNPNTRRVKETFVEFGAPSEILTDAKPHIGTDRLREVVINFRKKLLELGCEIRFGARVSDIRVRDGNLCGIIVNDSEDIPASAVVLAMGQNADDTYNKLYERGVKLEPKSFALGLRVEHPQELINAIQYGKWRTHAALPPADYFLTAAIAHQGRSVYTFCMCPGGQVIGCSSEPGGVVTNGMSRSARDGLYANSAVVVNVRTDDFQSASHQSLEGLIFRRQWEEKAFSLGGGNYAAPAQRLTDFLKDIKSDKLPPTSFLPKVVSASLRETLPPFATAALQEGLRMFEGKMPGFITEEAVLVGVETRTSSPVRILRDASGQSINTAGLYPCGEGAGYAGGIISSALDGIRAAENLLKSQAVRR